MSEQISEKISEFLRREEIQEHIRQRIQLTRRQITAPIGVAVGLTGLSENQLRKWEEKGLLSLQKERKQKERTHRYYSLQDLDKLVIISELLDAKFPLSSIPSDIDEIWEAVTASAMPLDQVERQDLVLPATRQNEAKFYHHIDQRIKDARQDLFWRYYTSHVLRYSLQLIREDIPSIENAAIGLIVPLRGNTTTFKAVRQADQLPMLGESLVGWLALSGSSHTLLTPAPSFENPNLYRLYQLRAIQEGRYVEEDESARALLVTVWKLDSLTLERPAVEIIRRLLTPLYENAQKVRSSFSSGWRDGLDPATDLNSDYVDYILNGLADMAVRSGTTEAGRQRWRYCCILVPGDNTLPLQRRSLVVRAQSAMAPGKVGRTFVSPDGSTIGIGLRAYQSGQIIYRSEVCEKDSTNALDELENPASVIAIPVEGVNDTPSAVLYLAADEPFAFNEDDQRVLRLIGRMVQEVLGTYRARQQASGQLKGILEHPEVIDTFFESNGILPESQFEQDIKGLLKELQTNLLEGRGGESEKAMLRAGSNTAIQPDLSSTDTLSIISVEIDDQARLARRYGDQFSQNLYKGVGSSLQERLSRILADPIACKLYYTCAGGFYLLLNKLSMEEAREHAERIRRHLDHEYEVSMLHSVNEKAITQEPENKLLKRVSVHVAVNTYSYGKLRELLTRHRAVNPIEKVRWQISQDIDTALNKGRTEGGNVVVTWVPESKRYLRWSP